MVGKKRQLDDEGKKPSSPACGQEVSQAYTYNEESWEEYMIYAKLVKQLELPDSVFILLSGFLTAFVYLTHHSH